jgi:hypothetical protein
MKHEHSSAEIASLASRLMRDPSSASLGEIRSLAASVLTQTRDRKPLWKRLVGG